KVTREVARARVQMRLEGGNDPPPRKRGARGGKRRANLGGVVRVVVDHGDPPRLAQSLESALHAAELREPRRHCGERNSERVSAAERRERVEHVVPPGHAK